MRTFALHNQIRVVLNFGMTATQENKLSMFLAVKSVCDRSQSVWQGLPAFATAFAEFSAPVETIQTLSTGHGRRKPGVAEDKKRLRKELCEAAFEVAAATLAYAKATKNAALAAKVDYSLSDLMIGRDTDSATRCEEVHAAASASLDKLADYGVTAAKLASLQDKITAYRDILTKPREAKISGKTTTTSLAAEFQAATDLLKDRLDNLIPQFRNLHITFMQDFHNSRLIVKANPSRKTVSTTIAATHVK